MHALPLHALSSGIPDNRIHDLWGSWVATPDECWESALAKDWTWDNTVLLKFWALHVNLKLWRAIFRERKVGFAWHFYLLVPLQDLYNIILYIIYNENWKKGVSPPPPLALIMLYLIQICKCKFIIIWMSYNGGFLDWKIEEFTELTSM